MWYQMIKLWRGLWPPSVQFANCSSTAEQFSGQRTFLVCRFCSNSNFQNFANIIFFCRFVFLFFFPANFSQPSFGRFTRNVARLFLLVCDLYQGERILIRLKTRSRRPKKHGKICQIFTAAVTFSIVVTKWLKVSNKVFLAIPSVVSYL